MAVQSNAVIQEQQVPNRYCTACGDRFPRDVQYCVSCGSRAWSALRRADGGTLQKSLSRSLRRGVLLLALVAVAVALCAGEAGSRLPARRTVSLGALAPAPLLELPPEFSGPTTHAVFTASTVAAPPVASDGSTFPPPAAMPDLPPSSGPLQLAAGERVQIGNLTGSACANVRDTPSLTGSVHVCLPSGTTAQLLDGPLDADGYHWWKIDSGGWTAADYLTAVAPVAVASQALPAIAPASLTPSLATTIEAALLGNAAANFSRAPLFGISGWATYYGIEDGFVRGDIMNDGTPYDPADPTITAASFALPLHTWLKVCSAKRCITVQVRDRGLLDQNGILLDLSRGAYALLFGGIGGKQWISAFPTTPTFPLPPNPVNLTP